MPDDAHCQVVTTTDSRQAADALARGAVTERAAACAQIVGPLTSTYWWEGAVEAAQEWQVIFKTAMDRYPALAEYIRGHHSYAVPEILCFEVSAGNPAYLAWLTAETRVVRSAP
jgi:periplasmic divalent cation tolerance protein